MRWLFSRILILCGIFACAPLSAQPQFKDPNAALANEVVVAQLPGRSISALVTHRPGATKFTHAIALFPGSPGYMNLRVEDGTIQFGLRGNFLTRARRFFLDEGFLTVLVDAPSDNQVNFWHSYRASERYGEDVKAIIEAVTKKYGALDWTFIGTSEGSVSAAHAARMLPSQVKRVVLTSSLVMPGSQGIGLRVSDIRPITIPVLWVHHRNDPCKYTQYSRVKSYAEETKTPLLTVTGAGERRGDPCEPFSEHGFVGMEVKTIRAIMSWIKTGQVPPDVSE
jgi:pimeloyl-ACP methyl ester carboxylesterase